MPKLQNVKLAAIATTIFALSLATFGCSESTTVATKVKKPKPVKLIKIDDQNKRRSQSYPAVIDAVQSSTLAFQVSGQVTKLNVIAAQEVKQGDVLAQLDQRDLVSQRDSAKAQYTVAENELERAIPLSKEGVISATEFEQVKSKRDVAKAQYDSAKKALLDSVLVAPYDAVIVNVNIKELENAQAGSPVISLMGRGQMEAIVNIPAAIVAKVDRDAEPDASVLLDAAPETPIHATFRRASLEADTATQTYQVRFAFTPPDNLNVLPGMNATLNIAFNASSGENSALSVPVFAILSLNEETFVWVVNTNDMTVTKRKVQVEKGIGESLMVVSGLSAGDVIVGAGASYLAEGMQVVEWTKS